MRHSVQHRICFFLIAVLIPWNPSKVTLTLWLGKPIPCVKVGTVTLRVLSKQRNSQIMGSTLLPMVTEGLAKVPPAVGSCLTPIFFMPVVRPKLVVKAANSPAAEGLPPALWKMCNCQHLEPGRGCSGTLNPAHSLGIPLSTNLVPTCSLAAAPSKHSWSTGRKGFSPEWALPSALKQQLVPASSSPDLDELCHTRWVSSEGSPHQHQHSSHQT